MLNLNRIATGFLSALAAAVVFGGNVQKAQAGGCTPGSEIVVSCGQTNNLCHGDTAATEKVVYSILSNKVSYMWYGYKKNQINGVLSDPPLENFLKSLELKPGVYSLRVNNEDITLEVVKRKFNF